MISINKEVAQLLNEQINLEIFSAYLYQEVANYFADENLDGFCNWFQVQRLEELDHGQLIIDFLRNSNVSIKLKTIEDPSRNYKTHVEVLEEVLKHEQYITASINKIVEKSQDVKDHRSYQFLQWFVAEQAEEEVNVNILLNKYSTFAKDSAGLYLLDKEFGERTHSGISYEIEAIS